MSVNPLFAEIQRKGDEITGMLRKVTDEEKVYKQKKPEGETGAVSFADLEKKKIELELKKLKEEHAVHSGNGKSSQKVMGPMNKLIGNRHLIQNHTGHPSDPVQITISDARMSHAIQINDCHHAVIQVEGKVNCVELNNSKRCHLIIQSVISTIQVTGCANVVVTVKGFAPSLALDKSTDIDIHLLDAEKAKQMEIVTSATAAINLNIPVHDEELKSDITVERPVPEQFLTRIVKISGKGYQLKTEPSSHC